MARGAWNIGAVTGLALAAALGGGCSADVFDVDVALMARTFVADFGSQAGTIPTVACTDALAQ